jgi:hypothetical protein
MPSATPEKLNRTKKSAPTVNSSPASDEAGPRLRGIVQALARQAARAHYAEACLLAKKDSDSES